MSKPLRLLALAAVYCLTIGAGLGSAQTVVATNAPQGSSIELVLNGEAVGTATVDPSGHASLPVNLVQQLKKDQTDLYIFVEQCGDTWRVILAERGNQPPVPPADCDRRDMGLFLVRRVSTLVVNVGGASPTVLLVQGRFDPRNPRPIRPWNAAPTGPVLSAGGGLMRFSEVESVACGDVSNCSGGGFTLGYTVGAAYWFKPFLAAEVSFVKPAETTASGAGENFQFTSALDARALAVAGKVAVPAGPIRVYGKAGGTFHQATFETSQTYDAASAPGAGTQVFEVKTEGWGWLFGGGVEVWLRRRLGAYLEVDFLKLKGSPIDDAAGDLSERVMSIVLGAHVHIGR